MLIGDKSTGRRLGKKSLWLLLAIVPFAELLAQSDDPLVPYGLINLRLNRDNASFEVQNIPPGR